MKKLWGYIDDFKSALEKKGITDKKVGTADSWNKFQDGTADYLIEMGVNLLYVDLVRSKCARSDDKQSCQRFWLLAISGHQ